MILISANNIIQASGTTTSTWDLVRQSFQRQSQRHPETTENVKTVESLNQQKQTAEKATNFRTERKNHYRTCTFAENSLQW